MYIGNKIKQVLLKRNLSIKELAGLMNCKPHYLYARIQRNRFSAEDLESIATALDCQVDIVFTLNDTGEKV